MFRHILGELRATSRSLLIVYMIIFLVTGTIMNQVGILLGIARFSYWWQILTCYGLYMVPIAIAVKKMPFHMQYLWGLFSMCLLEFLGYALGTSIALNLVVEGNTITNNGNFLAQIVDIKNFTLGMAMFFGLYYPALNALVHRLHSIVFR